MWKAASSAIRLIPELIQELPTRAKPAAAAAVISAFLLLGLGVLRIIFGLVVGGPLTGVLNALLILLATVFAIFIVLVLFGVAREFFEGFFRRT